MANGLPRLTSSPVKISIVYIIAAGLWFLFFDRVVAVFSGDAKIIGWAAIFKDLFFVAVTVSVLLWIVRRRGSIIKDSESSLRRVNRALMTLSSCNQALFRAEDESGLMKEICRIIVEVGGYGLAWVGIAEPDANKTIRPAAQWGYEEGYLEKLNLTWADTERGMGPSGTAIRSGLPSVVQNIGADQSALFWRNEALKHHFASTVSFPLTDGDKPFGALGIYAREPDAFDTRELDLLKELAGDLSYGLLALGARVQREREEKARMILATAFEQLGEGVAVFDDRGIVQYINASFERITGSGRTDVTGENVRDLGNGDGGGRQIFRAMYDATARKRSWSGRFTIGNGGKGPLFEIDARISPLRNDAGDITNYVFVSRDVSQEERLEKQLRQAQKMEALGTLAGGIAHDFNNILGAIISCSEFALEDAPEGSPTREDLEHVLKASYRGKNLIKQILTFSRRSEQEMQPVEIAPLVKECLKFLRASLPASIEIRQNIPSGLGMILADPTQIHQVIMNLCTNAAHAMREKGGILEVSLSEMTGDRSMTGLPQNIGQPCIRLAVSDTGHGMSQKILERIFDPFFTTKKRGEGTGLGLSVVHGIIMNHNGDISVSSEEGKGTTFEVFLPGIERTGDVPVVANGSTNHRGTERILFVDDEEDLVYAGEKMLRRLGYEPVVFRSSPEALEAFRARPDQFDLIITDQSMPHMTGTEFAREALRIRPDIPIVLCSGFSPDSGEGLTRQQAEEIGIREMKMKPLGSSEMAGIIRQILDEEHS